jgi:hypothetical protein
LQIYLRLCILMEQCSLQQYHRMAEPSISPLLLTKFPCNFFWCC